MEKVTVLIPSYNRPDILRSTLEQLDRCSLIQKIFVTADASSEVISRQYSTILSKYVNKVTAELTVGHRGSAKTRNAVRHLALQSGIDTNYVLLFDDDFELPNEDVLQHMIVAMKTYELAGLVGGSIVNAKKRKIDPEFTLPVAQDIANCLSSVTGFLFNGQVKRITLGKSTTCFMLIKSELLNDVSYDENYAGSGYREESDFQRQVINLGYSIVYDDSAYVYHHAPDEGGCREKQEYSNRMYWKSHNHTYFIYKWNRKMVFRFWFLLCSQLLFIAYHPTALIHILTGMKKGYMRASRLYWLTP